MDREKRYGLQLTNNSKTGPAFSLPRHNTCINKTDACTKVCYGRSIRYQSKKQKEKRMQNYETIELLMTLGGPSLVAQNLLLMIDQVKPIDWLTSKLTNSSTTLPWTLRIHDVGDYPEFRTIPCSKISEHKIEIVNHFDSASLLQHSA